MANPKYARKPASLGQDPTRGLTQITGSGKALKKSDYNRTSPGSPSQSLGGGGKPAPKPAAASKSKYVRQSKTVDENSGATSPTARRKLNLPALAKGLRDRLAKCV